MGIVRFDDCEYGEYLLSNKYITEIQHMTIQSLKQDTESNYFQCLRAKSYIDPEVQAQTVADFIEGVYVRNSYDLKLHPLFYDLNQGEIKQFRVVPIVVDGDDTAVGCMLTDPFDEGTMQYVDRVFDGKEFIFYLASEFRFMDFLERNTSILRNSASEFKTIDEIEVKVANILHNAIKERASDIHLFSIGNEGALTYRVDGHIRLIETIEYSVYLRLIERLQDPAITDIHDTNPDVPRSGKTHMSFDGVDYEFRINIEPSKHGLDCNLRLLNNEMRDIDALGLNTTSKDQLMRLINLKQGMIIFTGPTGSGKSTTMYALLDILKKRWLNIFAIEDPVEYIVPGITQLDVDIEKGITYKAAIASSLRHDPDVIVIGEMRSLEEAEDAFIAANTGHLVFSTLHTNSAVSAVSRLATMGIDRFSICESLTAVVGQRLIRCLCPKCKVKYQLSLGDPARKSLGLGSEPVQLYAPVGCDYCKGTGYYGRTVITEIFRLNHEIRDMIQRETTTYELTQMAEQYGFVSMVKNAIGKMLDGDTSLEEVMQIYDSVL